MTVGGISEFSNKHETPTLKQLSPNIKGILGRYGTEVPTNDKVNSTFLSFIKITKTLDSEGEKVTLKLAGFKHFEKKMLRDNLSAMSNDQLSLIRGTLKEFKNSKGIMGELGHEASKIIDEAMTPSRSDPTDHVQDEGNDFIDSALENDSSENNAPIDQFSETDVRNKLAETEYQPVLVTVDDQGNTTIALENPNLLSPEQLANAEIRFKYDVGEKPITISTRSLQIIELDKNSPVLAKAFAALLATRGHIVESEPRVTMIQNNASENKSSSSSSTTPDDMDMQTRVQVKRLARRDQTEGQREIKKLSGKETAIRMAESRASSAAAGSDKARRKRMEDEQDRKAEIIKDDIKAAERKKVKISEKSDDDLNIEDAFKSAEGIAPKKEKTKSS